MPRCTLPPQGAAAMMAAALHRAPLPTLQTARLLLRAPTLCDLPAWTAIYLDSFDDVGRGAQGAWTEFSCYTAGWLLHGHGLWTVERRLDGVCIGFVLLGLEWDDGEPELGWMLLPEHRGRGYATEAAAAARDHALSLLGAGRFVSYVDPANGASARVAARLDAIREGPSGSSIWRHGGRA